MRASATYQDSRLLYHALDGLRGVAALMVLAYYLFESFATSEVDQIVNHGYLAVDFFFVLSVFVVALAYDHRIGGWTMDVDNIIGRLLLILFSFSAGLLISSKFEPTKVKGGIWIAAVIMVILLGMPRIGGEEYFCTNGHYEVICTLFVFPFLYLYYSYIEVNGVALQESLHQVAHLYFGSIVVAILALKLYDEPVRKWLTKKLILSN